MPITEPVMFRPTDVPTVIVPRDPSAVLSPLYGAWRASKPTAKFDHTTRMALRALYDWRRRVEELSNCAFEWPESSSWPAVLKNRLHNLINCQPTFVFTKPSGFHSCHGTSPCSIRVGRSLTTRNRAELLRAKRKILSMRFRCRSQVRGFVLRHRPLSQLEGIESENPPLQLLDRAGHPPRDVVSGGRRGRGRDDSTVVIVPRLAPTGVRILDPSGVDG